MKSLIAHFVRDQSGAITFDDGLFALLFGIGFIVALALMNLTMGELYAAIFGMLTRSH